MYDAAFFCEGLSRINLKGNLTYLHLAEFTINISIESSKIHSKFLF